MVRWFLRLPPGQRRDTLRATIVLAAVRAGLGVVPLRALASVLGVRVGDARPAGVRLPFADSRATSVARVVDRLMSSGPSENRCLRRALVLGHLLRSEKPCVRIGVRRVDGQVQAHAWLEIRDRVVAEPNLKELETFRTLARS